MKTNIRIASLLLAALMALPLAACSQDKPADDTTAADPGTESTAPAETTVPEETTPAETARKDAKDNLPADLNLGGMTVGVISRNAQYRGCDVDGGEDYASDTVYTAVHNRTRKVEDRLKFKMAVTEFSGNNTAFGDTMEKAVLAGDNEWQIIFATSNATAHKGRDYLFRDLANAKYIDYEQPWWWTGAMEDLSLNGKEHRYLIGDIASNNLYLSCAVFFNKEIYKDSNGNPDDLYKLVIDRKWTYDKMREMAATAYVDLNGNGTVDTGDRYGLIMEAADSIRGFEHGTNIRKYSRGADGYPVLDYDLERAQNHVQKLKQLFYETKGVSYLNVKVDYNIFGGGTTLFWPFRLRGAVQAPLREMTQDYGIIPFPLVDDQQKEYVSLIHNSSDNVTVPMTCPNKDVDNMCAIIEALCAESYRSVTEVAYEQVLKTKYARDSYSGQCIDIIRATSTKSLMF